MNGANNSVVFTCQKGRVTPSNAKISTAQSKFSASAVFDGSRGPGYRDGAQTFQLSGHA
jgi:hypothetical protein